MSSVMIVDAEALPGAPAGFQAYVGQFFRETEILGRRCFVAAMVSYFAFDDWEAVRRAPEHNKGRAPCHSVDLRGRYDEGAPNNDLMAWISSQEGKLLWRVYASESRNTVHFEDD